MIHEERDLVAYFEINELFSPAQHDFRRGRYHNSSSDLIEIVLDSFEDSESTLLILCDLTKAFCYVSHSIMLSKIERYGFSCSHLQGGQQ